MRKITELSRQKMLETSVERFLKRVQSTDDPTQCWLWHRQPISRTGYPMLSFRLIQKHPLPAHRVAYWIANKGPPPKGKHVLHRCGNRRCCNPNHLYAGTPKDNYLDAVRDGTFKPLPHKQGEEVWNSKLTVETVLFIRAIYPMLVRIQKRTLAKLCGISSTHIRRIAYGQSWQHLDNQGAV